LEPLVLVLGPDSGVACVLFGTVAALALCLLRAGAVATKRSAADRAAVSTVPGVGGARPAGASVTVEDGAFRALSTLQLCGALRRSYLSGPDDTTGHELTRAWMRGRLLDEIERRDPLGFNRWLAATPCAGSDPGRHLTPGR
jgi:hypothetical protein